MCFISCSRSGASIRNWTDYLPVRDSWVKEEIVFVLRSINDCLVVFFRSQVLVAMCVGALLTAGFLAIGLEVRDPAGRHGRAA